MADQSVRYIIVCEGSSERAYLQELNKYLRESNIPLVCFAKTSDGGQCAKVMQKYREVGRANRNAKILIWVDKDRYVRNDGNDAVTYENRPKDVPDFLFTTMNFEDFLVMHLPYDCVCKWVHACTRRNHFIVPSHSREYLPEFQALLFPSYEKGSLPIQINTESLRNLKRHQEESSIPLQCDFAEKLFTLLPDVSTLVTPEHSQ